VICFRQMSGGFKILRRSFIRRKIKTTGWKKRNGFARKIKFVLENNFKRVSYTEAIDILREYK
jgi:aspartyl/asparaginyl-tRNA synthetase